MAPDYGAKAVLAVFQVSTIATGKTNSLVGKVVIPSTEDWYITDWSVFCVTQGTNAGVLTLLAGASAVQASKTLTLVSGDAAAATFTPDSGEDEGVRVAGGTAISTPPRPRRNSRCDRDHAPLRAGQPRYD